MAPIGASLASRCVTPPGGASILVNQVGADHFGEVRGAGHVSGDDEFGVYAFAKVALPSPHQQRQCQVQAFGERSLA